MHCLPIHAENSATAMQDALEPLHRLTEAGLAVLLCHHPRKGDPTPGQAARGSGALPAFADILLELHPFTAGDPTDRRRVLFGFSRWDDTPPRLVIELNPEGTAYGMVAEAPCSDFPDHWPMLQIVLEDAPAPLTRAQIHAAWGDAGPRPSLRTLWTWLSVACAQNLVARSGTGHANDPFRYWLPSRMSDWLADPLWRMIHGIKPPDEPAKPPPPEALSGDDSPVADPDGVPADPPPASAPPAGDERSPAPPPPLADPPVPSPAESTSPAAKLEQRPTAAPGPVDSFRRWLEILQGKA
jgi:hypothetical protein